MTLWLIRAGSRGEHEQKFLDEGRVYVAWDGLDVDLGALPDRQALIGVLEERFPDAVTFRKDVAGRRLFRPPAERVTPPRLSWHLAVH